MKASNVLKAVPAALRGHLTSCRMCPRECKVNRLEGERGFCGVGCESRMYAEFLHYGEEMELVPSHTIFFSGCNMRCVFCSNRENAMDADKGVPADARLIKRRVAACARDGAKTVNLLGGEPTCNLPGILRIFGRGWCELPIVWNSNLFFSGEMLPIIFGLADIFLADLKFGNDECASRVAATSGYLETVRSNLKAISGRKRLIVRHLMIPGHWDCCTVPAIEWLAGELPGARISILGSYMPPSDVSGKQELARTVTAQEHRRAKDLAKKKGLTIVE